VRVRALTSASLQPPPLPPTQGIDQLPIVPQLFELIGIAFSAWFVYRYLLFKPDRCVGTRSRHMVKGKVSHTRRPDAPHSEELKRTIAELKDKILA